MCLSLEGGAVARRLPRRAAIFAGLHTAGEDAVCQGEGIKAQVRSNACSLDAVQSRVESIAEHRASQASTTQELQSRLDGLTVKAQTSQKMQSVVEWVKAQVTSSACVFEELQSRVEGLAEHRASQASMARELQSQVRDLEKQFVVSKVAPQTHSSWERVVALEAPRSQAEVQREACPGVVFLAAVVRAFQRGNGHSQWNAHLQKVGINRFSRDPAMHEARALYAFFVEHSLIERYLWHNCAFGGAGRWSRRASSP